MPGPSDCALQSRLLLHRQYQTLIRKHLSPGLEKIFADFTGTHFHIAWNKQTPHGGNSQHLPTKTHTCCKIRASILRDARQNRRPHDQRRLHQCETFCRHHLATALQSDLGHRFTCPLGVRNFWYPIRLRNETLGIAYLQTLEPPITPPPERARPRAQQLPNVPQPPTKSGDILPAHIPPPGHRPASRKRKPRAVALNLVAFARATRFLRLIVQHIQTTCLCELGQADLTSADHALRLLESEQARSRNTPPSRFSGAAGHAPFTGQESPSQQVIHDLLQRIESGYAAPLTLKKLAADLRMNASYLSALFSDTIGIPFKNFLTELRMQKAKELLLDHSRTAAEVAFAVGYSSTERFRHVFRNATGLSPKVWRETMQRPELT